MKMRDYIKLGRELMGTIPGLKLLGISGRRAIRLVITVLLLMSFLPSPVRPQANEAYGNAQINVASANVRNIAGTSGSKVIAVLEKGYRVTACEVVELPTDPSGETVWCKIVFAYSGKTVTGYVVNAFLLLDEGETGDEAFEEEIKGFPDTYKRYLRVLHKNHPNWHFQKVNVKRDFQETVDLQARVGISLITNSANDAWKSTEDFAYDWKTDTYLVYDGKSWVNAARGVIEYYMDPRNMLNEQYVFQFVNLSYKAEMQPIESVQGILNKTFMESDKIVNMKEEEVSYAQTFVRAAELSGANPIFLASKCLQEVSVEGSGSTSGEYPEHEGFYNYFNVGAYSSTDPVAKGLEFAEKGTVDEALNKKILIPWNSPYRSICGGSIFIASQYIAKGQDSIYLMKFNVLPKSSDLYCKHQYMTNIQGAMMESKKMFTAYSRAGILDSKLLFTIPVYKNMPETPCSLPAQTGNPNNYLAELAVEGYDLTPDPDFFNIDEYSLVVPNSCKKINLTAKAVSSKAKVTGAGEIGLKEDVNEIDILVTAQNGKERHYKLTIARDTSSPVNYFEVDLPCTDTYYSGIEPGTTVKNLVSMFRVTEGYTLSYQNMNGKVKEENEKVATGDLFLILDQEEKPVYTGTIFIRGDANGDGNISAADLTLMTHFILGEGELSHAGLLAGDANQDGKVNAADLTVTIHHILGSGKIVQ